MRDHHRMITFFGLPLTTGDVIPQIGSHQVPTAIDLLSRLAGLRVCDTACLRDIAIAQSRSPRGRCEQQRKERPPLGPLPWPSLHGVGPTPRLSPSIAALTCSRSSIFSWLPLARACEGLRGLAAGCPLQHEQPFLHFNLISLKSIRNDRVQSRGQVASSSIALRPPLITKIAQGSSKPQAWTPGSPASFAGSAPSSNPKRESAR